MSDDPTPLVSDAELTELFIRFRADGTGGLNGLEELLARRIVAQTLQNAANRFQEEHGGVVGEYTLVMLREWADEELDV